MASILTSSLVMDLSGTPTYTVTMCHELERRGHRVVVYSPGGGALDERVQTASDLDGLERPDVILAQHVPCAVALRERFPDVPLIFSSHGVEPEVDQPPPFEADWYVSINEDGRDNMLAQGVPADRLTIVRDFVDIDRFQPTRLPRPELGRVLYISNHKKWRTHAIITEACRSLHLEFKACGSPYGRCYRVEKEIERADLVISAGRGVLEAMACGRPVVSFNQRRGDGYLTPELYLESRTRNFAGDKCRYQFDVAGLVGELEKYDPADGVVNRGLVLEHHDHRRGVDRLLEVLERVWTPSPTS